jgi:hypothetical protein
MRGGRQVWPTFELKWLEEERDRERERKRERKREKETMS